METVLYIEGANTTYLVATRRGRYHAERKIPKWYQYEVHIEDV